MRKETTVTKWLCDICSADMGDVEPERNYRFATGYAPVDPVGVTIHVAPFGMPVQIRDSAVCLACLDKALRGILADLFKPIQAGTAPKTSA